MHVSAKHHFIGIRIIGRYLMLRTVKVPRKFVQKNLLLEDSAKELSIESQIIN